MMKTINVVTAAVLVAGFAAVQTCPAQVSPPNLPPGVQDVVKLVKAGLGEDVVLAQIRHNGAMYNLSVDQIIFLHQQGVSPNEIKALIGSTGSAAPPVSAPAPVTAPPAPASTISPAPAPVPIAPAPAPVAIAPAVAAPAPASGLVSLDSFQAQLSPYGRWITLPEYGLCWRPDVESADPLWRPYCDGGHWTYTAEGWAWQSDYPWGDVVFHYGRWFQDSLGWVWAPGYDWAPAWVCWREGDGYCGWAPLPPGAVFRAGVGLWWGGRAAVDVDFGLGADAFVFVGYDHFWDLRLHGFLLPRDRVRFVFGHSFIRNGYRFDHGHFFVGGLGRDHMMAVTHHDIRVDAAITHDSRFHDHGGDYRGFGHEGRHDRW